MDFSPLPASPARAVFFDALGTLLELRPPAPALREELSERFALEVTEDEANHALAAEIAYYRQHLDDGRDEDSLHALRRQCAFVLRSALPTDAAAGIELGELTKALLSSLRFTLFEDALPALSRARSRGQRLVVVSNWDISLHGVLARLRVAPLLDGIITSAQTGSRKPSPTIFREAQSLIDARAEETIHVGDSVDEDVAGARAAGLTPVLLRRDGAKGPAGIRTISTLRELG